MQCRSTMMQSCSMQEWGEKMTADVKLWEQAAFNDLVHLGGAVLDNDNPDLFMYAC